jgi:hypothetical protein
MSEHDCVKSYNPLDNDEEYVYLVVRSRGLPDVRVHLTDAYTYSRAEYLGRPPEVRKRNSFILCNSFTGIPDVGLVNEARNSGIGIGAIGKFMGR